MHKDGKAPVAAEFENSEDLIWSVDREYRLLSFNEAARDRFERDSGVVTKPGLRPEDILPPEQAALWPPLYQRALQNGPFKLQYELPGHRILEVSFEPLWVEEQIQGVQVRGHDVTEQKHAAEALLAGEAKYREFVQGAAEGIFQIAPDRSLLTVNPAMARILGYDSVEACLAGVRDVMQDVWYSQEERLQFLQLLETQGVAHGFECRIKHKDGGALWVSLQARKILGPGGQTVRIEGLAEDISERKRLLEELREREARQRRIFMDSGSVMLLIEPEDGEIVDANEAAATYYGYPRQQLVGRNIATINTLSTAEIAAERTLALREERKHFNFRHLLASGEVRDVEVYSSPVQFGDRSLLFSVVHDITGRKSAEKLLQESEMRYRTAFHTSLDSMTITRLDDGILIDVNQNFLDIHGYRREEVVGRSVLDLKLWVNPEERRCMVENLRKHCQCRDLSSQFQRKNGEVFWGLYSSSLLDLDGIPCQLSVLRDISEKKAGEERIAATAKALQASEERYRGAFQTSLDAFTLSHLEDGFYLDVNQAFVEMLGYTRDEVLGRTSVALNLWKDTEDRKHLVEAMRRGASCRDLEFEWRKKNGTIFWVVVSATNMNVEGVPSMLAVIRDISAAKAAAEEIKNLAFYDPLTHLPNRRLLLDRLQQFQVISSRSGHNSALLFIDLDNFKTLNDTLGHHIGDLLLIEVARRMVECVRKADTVGRLGGDEFIVILEELSKNDEEAASQARHVAEKILETLEDPYQLGEHQVRCSASIGITIFGLKEQSADEVLRQADIAMYQAKSEGRGNLHFFAPVLQAAVNTRAALEEDLRRAIAEQQFVLHFQPQLDRTQLVACEALVRWSHPTQGLLSPNMFIPLAEETGLILGLGAWVLEAVCEQLAAWGKRPETAHLNVSVNISALQFRQPGFTDRVLAVLEESGANPKNLCLELTESTLLDSVDETVLKIAELKAHGVSFALDDFGTGYSSLSYLKRLPIDQLKIDRSFIHDILIEASSGAIVQTIVSLGRAIGLSIVAEGVESIAQRDFLDRLGCHSFQGYLFSPPLSLTEFEAMWLKAAVTTPMD